MVASAPVTVHEDFSLKYLFADLRSEPGKAILIFETSESDDPNRRSLIRSEIEAELRKLKFVVPDPSWPGKHTAQLEVFITMDGDRSDALQRAQNRARTIVESVRYVLESLETESARRSTRGKSREQYVNRPQIARH